MRTLHLLPRQDALFNEMPTIRLLALRNLPSLLGTFGGPTIIPLVLQDLLKSTNTRISTTATTMKITLLPVTLQRHRPLGVLSSTAINTQTTDPLRLPPPSPLHLPFLRKNMQSLILKFHNPSNKFLSPLIEPYRPFRNRVPWGVKQAPPRNI